MPLPTHVFPRPPIIVIMGVSGSGKSTIARLLTEQLSLAMLEGDDLHPPENRMRMAAGVPLNDADRGDWLRAIAARISVESRAGRGLIVSCSALKRSYRDVLRQADPDLVLVSLVGGKHLIHERLRSRRGHFMPLSLLDSQFDTLEAPTADEHGITCDIAISAGDIVALVIAELARRAS